MELAERLLTTPDGTRLFVRAGQLPMAAKAHVVVVHGRGEHSGRYRHVLEKLAAHGFNPFTFDLRGHGRSGGRRGDAPNYETLLGDLDLIVKEATSPGRPLFIFAHSLGGQIALNYLMDHPSACQGAIIASPYLRLAFQPSRWRLAVAELARTIWPSLTLETLLITSRLSKDKAHLASFADLDLIHHRISARMYYAVKGGAEQAMTRAWELRVPILLLHGDQDPVTSVEATREFFQVAGAADKTLKIYDGMLHETHNEIGRERVLDDVVQWLEAHV